MSLSDRLDDVVSPDDDVTYEDSVVSRVLLVMCGALLVRIGFSLWATLEPASILGGVAVIVVFAAASQLLIFATTGFSMRKHGKKVAYVVIGALVIVTLAAVARGFLSAYGTDAMAFSKYASMLTLDGANPYVADMKPALNMGGTARQFATPQIDGTEVHSLSYPAGSFLVFLPAELIGIQLRLTTLGFVAAVAGFLVWQSPPQVALGGVLAVIAGRNLFSTAVGGTYDVIWVLPVLVTMALWYREHWVAGAVAMGIACSIKQLPWAILPFVMLWTLKEPATRRAKVRRAGSTLAAGLATFGLINLPWIIAAPRAWLTGVLTPLGGDGGALVHQGVGTSLLTTLDIMPLPIWWHTLAVLATLATLMVAYWLYFERLKWAAFALPLALWLVHYRSLVNYWAAFIPLAYYAALLQFDGAPGLAVPAWLQVGYRDRNPRPEVAD